MMVIDPTLEICLIQFFLGKIKVDSQVFTFYNNHADSLFCQLIVQKAKQVLRHYFYILKKKIDK
jgi:hypothetical protein